LTRRFAAQSANTGQSECQYEEAGWFWGTGDWHAVCRHYVKRKPGVIRFVNPIQGANLEVVVSVRGQLGAL